MDDARMRDGKAVTPSENEVEEEVKGSAPSSGTSAFSALIFLIS